MTFYFLYVILILNKKKGGNSMPSPSVKTKLKEHRGTGVGESYKPFIKSREVNSLGTCSNVVDWKHGRQMQLLSQVEYGIYMQLRWRDDVIDIREQFPLDMVDVNSFLAKTNAELKENGFKTINPLFGKEKEPMTTDMLLTMSNGTYEAITVKYDKNNLSEREIEKIWFEKKYWNSKGVPFRLMDKTDVNDILVKNIRMVVEYYDKNRVYDDISAIKHLIATKQILVEDIETQIIDFSKLAENIRKEGKKYGNC